MMMVLVKESRCIKRPAVIEVDWCLTLRWDGLWLYGESEIPAFIGSDRFGNDFNNVLEILLLLESLIFCREVLIKI
jgi:hypothetical protein